jgi:ribonuclease G
MSGAKIIVNEDPHETRLVIIEDGRITGFHIERKGEENLLGNVYLGKVARVIPGMQAAFVDIGMSRAAFLPGRQVLSPELRDALQQESDDEGGEGESAERTQRRRRRRGPLPIQESLRSGAEVLVQIIQQPAGMKGAKVTTYVSLPGHFCVFMPTIRGVGVSRRIEGRNRRHKLKQLAEALRRKHDGGFILRTASSDAATEEIEREAGYIASLWKSVLAKGRVSRAPGLLFREWDLTSRILRENPDAEVEAITVDSADAHEKVREYLERAAPQHLTRLSRYRGTRPIFEHFGIEKELERIFQRLVPLPSGGTIVIDQAEALTAIDVNTGSFTGKGGRNAEETITQTNLEAVKAIAYQLKLRNIGGLIILDLIDMERSENRDKVYQALLKELERDRAKTTVRPISSLGLIEMTRERYGDSPMRLLNERCWYCDGTGSILSKRTICARILRAVMQAASEAPPAHGIRVTAHQAVVLSIEHEDRHILDDLRERHNRDIVLEPRVDIHIEYHRVETVPPGARRGD